MSVIIVGFFLLKEHNQPMPQIYALFLSIVRARTLTE